LAQHRSVLLSGRVGRFCSTITSLLYEEVVTEALPGLTVDRLKISTVYDNDPLQVNVMCKIGVNVIPRLFIKKVMISFYCVLGVFLGVPGKLRLIKI